MDWVKLTVRADRSAEELITQILTELGANGVEIEDDHDRLALEAPPTWDLVASVGERMPYGISAYYPAEGETAELLGSVQERLNALDDIGKTTIETEIVSDSDWTTAWKRFFQPVRAADYIVVKPSWCEYAPDPEQIVLEIDPGMAFGTGNHETTRLSVSMLEQYLCPGETVVDVGTGSGVLALAAVKLGAEHVYALDVDPLAVETARKNGELNDVSNRITFLESDLLSDLPEGIQADIVVCNIIADAILRLIPDLDRVLRKNGMFLCSGTIESRQSEVLSALYAARMRVIRVLQEGEWIAIACKYKP